MGKGGAGLSVWKEGARSAEGDKENVQNAERTARNNKTVLLRTESLPSSGYYFTNAIILVTSTWMQETAGYSTGERRDSGTGSLSLQLTS
jgi:hypothetical protein